MCNTSFYDQIMQYLIIYKYLSYTGKISVTLCEVSA